MGGNTDELLDELVQRLRGEERKTLTDTVAQRISEGVRESLFKGLNLAEYVSAKELNCNRYHRDCKVGCQRMVKAAKIVLKEQPVSLPKLWREVFTGLEYDCEKAKRKILQMPVAILKINGSCVVVEKGPDSVYDEIIGQYSKTEEATMQSSISPESFKSLLNAAPNCGESERMKHLMASSHNMSVRQGAKFGIARMKQRAEKVISATTKINKIKNKHQYFAKIEQKVLLQSAGQDSELYLSSDSSNSDDSDDDDFCAKTCTTRKPDQMEQDYQPDERKHDYQSDQQEQNHDLEQQKWDYQPDQRKQDYQSDYQEQDHESKKQTQEHQSRNGKFINDAEYIVAFNVLREVQWNWFSFVTLLEQKFEKRGYTQEKFDQFLADFANRLPDLGLSNLEFNLAEQSCEAYLSEIMQKETRIEEIVAETVSDDDDNDSVLPYVISEEELKKIHRNLKRIKYKAKRLAKAEIELEGLHGWRKPFERSNTVLSRHPDIGKVMEDMVKEADVGADKWRRTGVYTFTGETKREKKMTFKKLQEKLSAHYGKKFSYETVIQLCVHRNKRRKSSKRYKGAANIRYQRPRKGFSLKFNPDTKWSRSLYKCLDNLQIDGSHIILLNRDDQAGFRLDSTFNHKSAPSLNVDGPTLTTHTDFLNKHQTQLQTTNYNFTQTTVSKEVCVGVVKACGVHQKNPCQHAADLDMLHSMEAYHSLFYKETREAKDIECNRVDGATDEGPSHEEVQFLWTERHTKRPTKITLVTTRSSGDSFLNRVELQNGCLSRGHSNLFIPSTLCGEPYDDDGQFDDSKHRENMEAALQQYIARVDGTPCMGTGIYLHKGVGSHNLLERRTRLLVFLKGNVKDRAELKKSNPEEYQYFTKIWQIRQNHMDSTLPIKYAYFLRCCGKRNCPHPLCKAHGEGKVVNNVNPQSKNEVTQQVFCICRKPEANFMVCCDQCGEWYHGHCVSITEEEGEKMECYICQMCKGQQYTTDDFTPSWYPGGPSFKFFPYPVIDTTRPWGSQCTNCGGCCSGHYVTKVDKLLELHRSGKAIRSHPPNTIIEEAFKKGTYTVQALAKKCCLTTADVEIWLQYLQKKKATREKAVLKAKETR